MPSPNMQGQGSKTQGDGTVSGYERIVNGRVVKVNSYAQRTSTSTIAAQRARLVPGRPRIAAQPGSYASGRDLPGDYAIPKPAPFSVPGVAGGTNSPIPGQQADTRKSFGGSTLDGG